MERRAGAIRLRVVHSYLVVHMLIKGGSAFGAAAVSMVTWLDTGSM
jgi:hypothetical protein